MHRPEFDKLISKLRSGDTLIVFSLDRLGRTSKQLMDLLSSFKEKKINFKSLTEGVFDTTSPMGEAIFQIIAILKAMEVNVLRELTVKGLEAAKLEGRVEVDRQDLTIRRKPLQLLRFINKKNRLTLLRKRKI